MTAAQLPDGWEWLPLKQIAVPRLGGNYRNRIAPSARPLIKMGNIARIRMDLSRLEYIPANEKVLPEHRLRYGDVLLNTRNTLDLVGKVSIWRNELPRAYYNSNILRLEFRHEYCASSVYFGYALNSKSSIDAIRSLATGTTSVAAVYTRDLLKLRLPVPPKEEQSSIASVLIDIDDLITTLDRLITKKEAVKQGMMQQLLTGHTRLPGYSAKWNTVHLGDVASTGSGGTPDSGNSMFYGGGIPWVSISDMTSAGKYVTKTEKTLSPEGLARSAAKLYESNVVLYAMYASLGECALPVGRMSSSQAILGILPRRQLDREFLYYYLCSMKTRVKEMGQQGTQANLNAGMVRDFQFELPRLDEQSAIAAALSRVDREIDVLRHHLAKSKSVKQGMMQELLTGRTRLPVKEPAI